MCLLPEHRRHPAVPLVDRDALERYVHDDPARRLALFRGAGALARRLLATEGTPERVSRGGRKAHRMAAPETEGP